MVKFRFVIAWPSFKKSHLNVSLVDCCHVLFISREFSRLILSIMVHNLNSTSVSAATLANTLQIVLTENTNKIVTIIS